MRFTGKLIIAGLLPLVAACGSGSEPKIAPPAFASGATGTHTSEQVSSGNTSAGTRAGIGQTRQITTPEFTLDVTLVEVIDPDAIPGATPVIPNLPAAASPPGPLRFVTVEYRITNKGPGTLRQDPGYSQSPLTTNIDTATGGFPGENYWTSTAAPKLDFDHNPLSAGQTVTGAVTATVPIGEKITQVKLYAGTEDSATAIWQTP